MVEDGGHRTPGEEIVAAWRDGEPTAASGFTCPSCGGALWELENGDLLEYRCHVGHVYSQESMLALQGSETEDALWAAHSLLEARAALLTRLAHRVHDTGAHRVAERYEQQAEELRQQGELLRRVAKGFQGGEPLAEPAA